MASHPIYQFYAELCDYTPKVWRRFQVSGNTTIARLSYVLMSMFEMQACHLFSFYLYPKKLKRVEPIEELIFKYEILDKESFDYLKENERLCDATRNKVDSIQSSPQYISELHYDFGDDWKINIVLESVTTDNTLNGRELPRVLAGEGYGIIEDCGGVHGLKRIAKALKQKPQVATQERPFLQNLDLEIFDIEDANFRLKKLPRIFTDIYEHELEPTPQSIKLLERAYLKKSK